MWKRPEAIQLITVDLSDIPKLPNDLYLPKDALCKDQLVPVHQLILRRNSLNDLDPYMLAMDKIKTHLMHLSLRENQFTLFPSQLALLPQLTSLSLAENRIDCIPPGIFPSLNSLQWLNLTKNALRSLPLDLVQCTKLRGLDVSHNQLAIFPEAVFFLPYLKALLLDGNCLRTVPSPSHFPAGLEVLSLAGNRLTLIPSCLVYHPPPALAHLNLSGTEMGHLPEDFLLTGYEQLSSLDLHSCALQSCPVWFLQRLSTKKALRRINLALNAIEHLPEEVGALTGLQWLNLNGNRLSMLPASMARLTGLVKLGLAQNRLETLPPLLFLHMQRLEKLDVRRNRLKYWPPSFLTLIQRPARASIELAVAHQVFSSFLDPPVVCDLHQTGALYEQIQCHQCCPFGGRLEDLFQAGNVRLQYVSGLIVCLDQAYQVFSQAAVTACLDRVAAGNHSLSTGSLTTALAQDLVKQHIFLGCHTPMFSKQRFDDAIPPEPAQPEPVHWSAWHQPRTLYQTALIACLNRTLPSRLSRQTPCPDQVQNAIRQALVKLPSILTEPKAEQCDRCLSWYTDSLFYVGHTVLLPQNALQIPIRYHLCSLACALDTLVDLYLKSKAWQLKHT
ncbi:hypothetical protein BY458DRAFT_571978 [Sporodiniella umbellata]|nr:hypothetical protein BY458DRAFT_571978 [Sporodiniella umbellata]